MCNITFNVFTLWGFHSFIFFVFVYFIMCEYHRTFKTYTLYHVLSYGRFLSFAIILSSSCLLYLCFFNVWRNENLFWLGKLFVFGELFYRHFESFARTWKALRVLFKDQSFFEVENWFHCISSCVERNRWQSLGLPNHFRFSHQNHYFRIVSRPGKIFQAFQFSVPLTSRMAGYKTWRYMS